MANSVKDETHDMHPIFVTDPQQYMDYIYKEVCILTEDGTTHTGRCYTVDPVSQSVALAKFDENMVLCELKLVMGHCVENITILDEDTERYKSQLDKLFKHESEFKLSPEEIEQRKNKLKDWLLRNLIPVEISGEHSEVLSISDALFIEPPYTPDNCRSTNEIILGRIQGLIKSMPKNIREW